MHTPTVDVASNVDPEVAKVEFGPRYGDFEVTIPSNGTRITAVQRLLTSWYLPELPDNWNWNWKVGGKGEYVGAFPKRVAKWVYQRHNLRLSAERLSELGNVASQQAERDVTYWFDFVTEWDWSPGDFGDDDSCYWTCHVGSKRMIEDNGGCVVRFYRSDNHMNGWARAWMAPWKDCWVVANGYGMSTLEIARILSVFWGHAYYRRCGLANNGSSDGALYINGGSGYLIGPQEQVTATDYIELGWIAQLYTSCFHCDAAVPHDDSYEGADGHDYCDYCWKKRFFTCRCCSKTVAKTDGLEVLGGWLCKECGAECAECGNVLPKSAMHEHADEHYCRTCQKTAFDWCSTPKCLTRSPKADLETIDDLPYCKDCAAAIHKTREREEVAHVVEA